MFQYVQLYPIISGKGLTICVCVLKTRVFERSIHKQKTDAASFLFNCLKNCTTDTHKKSTEHKLYVLIFCTNFVRNFFAREICIELIF